ncbi:hypothetical protein V2J09_002072 [Rumex salicifolius]
MRKNCAMPPTLKKFDKSITQKADIHQLAQNCAPTGILSEMGVWSEKVVPIIHKFFWKDDSNKTAAEQACKSFDESKVDGINKEVEEKKRVIKPKVIEIYEASSTEIKSLIKEPKEFDLRKHSDKVKNFLDKLVKIDFPGSQTACEVTTKYGLTLAPGPALFIFEKVSIFIVIEEEAKAPLPPQPTTKEPPATTSATTTTTLNREVATKEAVVKEPLKGNAPAVTGKEPPKVDNWSHRLLGRLAALGRHKGGHQDPPWAASGGRYCKSGTDEENSHYLNMIPNICMEC